jgi:hypothetical protein
MYNNLDHPKMFRVYKVLLDHRYNNQYEMLNQQ